MSFPHIKTLSFIMLGLVIFGVTCAYAAKEFATYKAREKAAIIIDAAYKNHDPQTPEEKITALTRYVFNHFEKTDPSSDIILRLRPYLTSRYLPSFIRLPSGVIETHIQKGLCDNAARMLAFILKQEGYKSRQWNMVTARAGHSALLVHTENDKSILADPFYGYVTDMHPETVQAEMRSGGEFEEFFILLGKNSAPDFYKDFATAKMAAEGDDLVIEATLPVLGSEAFIHLGKINGSPQDVKGAAMKHGMSPYWQYMGHRYNREWVRVLRAVQPVTLTFTLTQPAEEGMITSTPQPAITGKDLIWQLDKGDKITFRDGDAKISLRRMNSYIDVDRITIEAPEADIK